MPVEREMVTSCIEPGFTCSNLFLKMTIMQITSPIWADRLLPPCCHSSLPVTNCPSPRCSHPQTKALLGTAEVVLVSSSFSLSRLQIDLGIQWKMEPKRTNLIISFAHSGTKGRLSCLLNCGTLGQSTFSSHGSSPESRTIRKWTAPGVSS